MSDEPSEAVVSAWVGLLRAHRRALGLVEERLKAAGLPPLAWYDALLELERAGAAGMRPFELERATLVQQYNLSRLIDRLERAGYVERSPCPGDGRGQFLHLTAAGRDVRRRSWPVYAAAIEEAVGSRLEEADAARLAALLRPLAGDG